MWRLAEPDVLVDMTGFGMLDGDRPAVNLDAEIADLAFRRKLRRLQTEDPVQHRVDFGSTFGAISAIPTTVSSSVPGTSYFSSGMRLIRGCCAAKKQAWKRRQR